MSIRKIAPAMLLAVLLLAPAAITSAQTPAPIQPQAPTITMEQARRIAADNGMVRVEEIELNDGLWAMDGRDSAGAAIQIRVRASDGTVVKIERDRPASAEIRR